MRYTNDNKLGKKHFVLIIMGKNIKQNELSIEIRMCGVIIIITQTNIDVIQT